VDLAAEAAAAQPTDVESVGVLQPGVVVPVVAGDPWAVVDHSGQAAAVRGPRAAGAHMVIEGYDEAALRTALAVAEVVEPDQVVPPGQGEASPVHMDQEEAPYHEEDQEGVYLSCMIQRPVRAEQVP